MKSISKNSRRDFLKKSIIGATAIGIPAFTGFTPGSAALPVFS